MPIILTPKMKSAIEILIAKRPSIIPQANKFVFAYPTKNSLGHMRGWDCVSASVKEIEASLKSPKAITSTKLRKYIATVSQTAALTPLDDLSGLFHVSATCQLSQNTCSHIL